MQYQLIVHEIIWYYMKYILQYLACSPLTQETPTTFPHALLV